MSKLVWAYGPRDKKQRMLLLAIAEHANDDGYAYPGERLLAEETLQDVRSVQRHRDRLVALGWLAVQPRSAGVVTRGGQYQLRGTAYQINLAKLRGELPTRQGQQAAAGATSRSTGQGSFPVAGAVQNVSRDDKTGDSRRQNEHSETTKQALRDDKITAPLLNHHEPPKNHHRNTNQPLPLPFDVDCEETSKSKSADQGQERKATASANATATPSANEAAVASTERVGEASLSSGPGFRVGSNVIPFGRRARRDADPREGLDGEEAALFDETMRVLGACGIAPKNATRRQCNAVTEALRMHVACNQDCSIAQAGTVATETWDAYLKAHSQGLLWRVVGLQKFFAEGYWLENGHPWDWNASAVADRQRRINSGIGMQRG